MASAWVQGLGDHGRDVVGVVGGEVLGGYAGGLEHGGDVLRLNAGVLLPGGVDNGHGLNVGQQLLDQGQVVAHIGQIGVAGDIGAGGLIGVHDAGGDVVGDGGAHNGDGGGGLLGGLGRQGGVGHDQVNIVGNELGNDRGAVGRLIAGVLIVKLHLVAQQLGEGVLKALGGLVQGGGAASAGRCRYCTPRRRRQSRSCSQSRRRRRSWCWRSRPCRR